MSESEKSGGYLAELRSAGEALSRIEDHEREQARAGFKAVGQPMRLSDRQSQVLRVETVSESLDHDGLELQLDTSADCGYRHSAHLGGEHCRLLRLTGGTLHTSELSDQLGALRTENDELLRENAQLRRKIERLERKR